MVRGISLGVVLFVTWYLLSGHDEPLILGLGVASCAAVVAITWRMDVVDREGHPIHLSWRAATYWLWLFWEIVKANYDVAKRSFGLAPISPTMVRVKATQKTDLGLVIFANSITLTPGTISIEVNRGEILVHALSVDGAEGLLTGDMDRRATGVEGEV